MLGLPARLRLLLAKINSEIGTAGRYPRTEAALKVLGDALQLEFPRKASSRQKRGGNLGLKYQRTYQQAYRLRKENKKLKEENTKLRNSKSFGGRLSQEWILRVFLACPHASRRALAHSFSMICSVDGNVVSRPSIGKVKDAFCQMYMRMTLQMANKIMTDNMRGAGKLVSGVCLVHVQDEAGLRLRSYDPRDGPSFLVAVGLRRCCSIVSQ